MRVPAILSLLLLVAACNRSAEEEIIIVDPIPVVPAEPAFDGKL
ncbi:hypothetical protein BCF33_0167 [Hasllibacter halocynthiae]|uniref:Lipoprotein n=2 Tax=Hasllibacter halocynthiae TaxID=595589 RepID=A0A2T0X6Q8_9RHOB|nr:hypothetical protein BCF33_0167 [Hasllibacter halocynthiae]